MAERALLPKNITRYDGPKGKGHLVRFKRRGRTTRWKWFFDSAYGGREGSRRAALAYWRRMVLKVPVALRVMRRHVRNKSGAVGVYLDYTRDERGRKHWNYRAAWPEASGRRARLSFSVRKYGKAWARAMAVKARREGLRQLKVAKRADLRRAVGFARGGSS